MRELATRLRPDWQEEQALLQEKENSWQAAAFHRAWAATGEPQRAEHWQKLGELCEKLHEQWKDEEKRAAKVPLGKRDLLAWKYATDAFIRVLKEQPKIELKLPAENDAPGLHLALALAYHRLGDGGKAKECYQRVQLPNNASARLTSNCGA